MDACTGVEPAGTRRYPQVPAGTRRSPRADGGHTVRCNRVTSSGVWRWCRACTSPNNHQVEPEDSNRTLQLILRLCD
ncbi:hypothetical protein EYF80_050672 [Liparis tanakae]|uniref:Uncharacterized protein n=1 Tax=Liparis tanakae TaxID=230148 RepID=A0A4Z2FD44_9TELE|nr:hypothetical protein EYF80_050672 [Liparis tanakae]